MGEEFVDSFARWGNVKKEERWIGRTSRRFGFCHAWNETW